MGGAAPIIGGLFGLFGALSQQQQAQAAQGLSREALELQKRVIDAYLKEMEELKPYREGLRKLSASMLNVTPYGWSNWTSWNWRLPSLPPAQFLIDLSRQPITQPGSGGGSGSGSGGGGSGGSGGSGGGGGSGGSTNPCPPGLVLGPWGCRDPSWTPEGPAISVNAGLDTERWW